MKRSITLALALAALLLAAGALAAWLARPAPAGHSAAAPGPADATPAGDAEGASLVEVAAPPQRDAEPLGEGAASVPSEATGTLLVSVLPADRTGSAAGVLVRVTLLDHFAPQAFPLEARTDARGQVTFEHVPPGALVARGATSGLARGTLEAGATARLELALEPGYEVRGRVRIGAGATAAAYAEVRLLRAASERDGPLVATADSIGGFTLRDVPPGAWLSVRGQEHGASALVGLQPPRSGPLELEILLPERALRLVGQVVDEREQALAGAAVCVEALDADGGVERNLPWLVARTDAEGHFDLRGVAPTRARLIALQPGFAPREQECDFRAASERTELIVRLERGATITGRVLTAEGVKAGGVEVALLGASDFSRLRTRSTADGSYALRGVPIGEAQLEFGGERRRVSVPRAGLSRCDLRLAK